jgi:hypothetical protein
MLAVDNTSVQLPERSRQLSDLGRGSVGFRLPSDQVGTSAVASFTSMVARVSVGDSGPCVNISAPEGPVDCSDG